MRRYIQACQERANYTGDRISELPDDILIVVLSLLSLREAVVTSVLSRRWRYLWTSIPHLDFDANIEPSISKKNEQERGNWVDNQQEMVNWVNTVIKSRERAPSNDYLEEFRVYLDLSQKSQQGIDSWFQFALSKRVQKLEFDFSDEFGYCNFACGCYKISFELLSKMGEMLMREHPKPSTTLINNPFVFLRSLCFWNVHVTPEALQFLLLKCAALESLSLNHVMGLTDVIVSGPSLKLKYLEIRFCFELSKIEIFDANVVSVRYRGGYEMLSLRNLPCLVELDFETLETWQLGTPLCGNMKDAFRSFSFCFSQLERLSLLERQEKECYDLRPYQFTRLKQLELLICPSAMKTLLVYTPLLKAAPNLEKLVIETMAGRNRYERSKIRRAKKWAHQFLKVVEFHGYTGHVCDLELVLYLVENSVLLESITINPNRKDFFFRDPRKSEDQIKMEARARRLAKRQLQRRLPSQVKLKIL